MSDTTADDMGDVEKAEALYATTVSFQAINATRHTANMKLLRRGVYASVGLNLLLGIAVATNLSLTTYVPILGFINEAGIYETGRNYADIPLTQQAAGIESTISMYVTYRERYVPSEADSDYDIVSKLSNETVRREYQTDANPKLNSHSPASQVGLGGYIRIHVIKGADWISHADDYSTGKYKIRFCRTVVVRDQIPASQLLEEQITYEKAAGVPVDQLTTFNPAAIVITSYPPSREEGAPGAVNPCTNL